MANEPTSNDTETRIITLRGRAMMRDVDRAGNLICVALEEQNRWRAPLLPVSKSHIEYTHPPHGSKRTQLSRVIADPLGLLSFSALRSTAWTGERP